MDFLRYWSGKWETGVAKEAVVKGNNCQICRCGAVHGVPRFEEGKLLHVQGNGRRKLGYMLTLAGYQVLKGTYF